MHDSRARDAREKVACASGARARRDSGRAAMGAPVHAALCACFDPGPARGATLIAHPLFPRELARRRRGVEVSFALRHLSRAGMTRDVEEVTRLLAVDASRPWARQLAVLVTMLGAGLHHFDARCMATSANVDEGFRNPRNDTPSGRARCGGSRPAPAPREGSRHADESAPLTARASRSRPRRPHAYNRRISLEGVDS